MTRTEAAQMIRWLRIRRDGERYAASYSRGTATLIHDTKADAYNEAAHDLALRFHAPYRLRYSNVKCPVFTNLPALRIAETGA